MNTTNHVNFTSFPQIVMLDKASFQFWVSHEHRQTNGDFVDPQTGDFYIYLGKCGKHKAYRLIKYAA